jgi:hypothetical protein
MLHVICATLLLGVALAEITVIRQWTQQQRWWPYSRQLPVRPPIPVTGTPARREPDLWASALGGVQGSDVARANLVSSLGESS